MKDRPENPANKRHQLAAQWLHRWNALIFFIGSAATIFLIVSILLFITESWIPGAITTLATMLSGGAVGWLLARRQDASAAEAKAFKECREAEKAEEEKELRRKTNEPLFGRK